MKKLLLLLFTLSLFLLSCGKSGEDVKNAVSKKAYTVDFNTNGGTTVSAITVEEGKKITEPAAPTKTGLIFEGWYKETGLTNKWNFDTDMVTTNTTLYAKWVKNSYTVNFETNGGTTLGAITVEEGKTIKEPTAPTKHGFAFEGWYKETGLTNKWNFSTATVTSNTTLYAKWVVSIIQNVDIFVEAGKAGTSGPTIDKSFYIQKYEVTQAQFEALMGYNPSYFTGKPNNPVEQVTWYDAVKYANELSDKEGLSPYYTISGEVYANNPKRITSATVTENTSANGYRLPTEQEWEYAARGGKESNNYTYAGSNTIGDVAWCYDNNTSNGEISGTKAVGRKKGNELGIYDMSGNVWEWTNSLYDPKYTFRVYRGGSWVNDASKAAVPSRSDNYPNYYYYHLGFRLVRAS